MGHSKNTYFSRENGRWAPTSETQRKMNSENVGAYTDYMLRQKNKKGPEKGPKAQFLDQLNKNGYESAKKIIKDRYGEDAFSDKIFEKWREEASKIKNRDEDDDAR